MVAFRTTFAALLLLVLMLLFFRRYLYIYPAGLLGCLLAGLINGTGSLFYYYALSRINANLGQALYALYPLFLVIWLSLDHQRPGKLTLFRLGLVLPAVFLLVKAESGEIDPVGVGAMLVAALLYALHLPINQRVLYDMPPQTVTLYTLLAMSAVVLPAFLFSEGGLNGLVQQVSAAGPANLLEIAGPLLGLTLVTFFARLMLFTGVKHLGGMQTALLGLSELIVTLVFSFILLDEYFTTGQWLGAALLTLSLALVGLERPATHPTSSGGFLSWLRPAGLSVDPHRLQD